MDGEMWGRNSPDSKIPASLFQPRGCRCEMNAQFCLLLPAPCTRSIRAAQIFTQTLEDVTDRTSKAHTKDGKTEIMIYPSLKEGPIEVSSHVHKKWGLWSMCWATSKPLIKQINPINFESKSGRKALPFSEMFSVIVAACFLHYCISNSM